MSVTEQTYESTKLDLRSTAGSISTIVRKEMSRQATGRLKRSLKAIAPVPSNIGPQVIRL